MVTLEKYGKMSSNAGNLEGLYFISIKNKILLLDPPANENSDVSFAPHKTPGNTTTFLVFRKTLT